jgi:hypothetical protein
MLAALAIQGCGGTSVAGLHAPTHPNAKTKAHVTDVLAGYSQSIACNSFTGYGPRLLTHGDVVFDSILGLWYTVRVGPSGMFETLYQDKSKADQAGTLEYLTNDAAQTLGGPISVTLGPYAGLSGVYLQSLQSLGSNGSIEFTVPNIGTTNSQFEFLPVGNGDFTGKATVGVALQSGYLQTELVNYVDGGAMNASTTDSNSCKTKFSFATDLSGTGQITGADQGLPAMFVWSTGGTGIVTYADGSTTKVTAWQLDN